MGRDTRIVGKEALASTSVSTFPDADTVGEPPECTVTALLQVLSPKPWISCGTR